jgi:hypothetical protein
MQTTLVCWIIRVLVLSQQPEALDPSKGSGGLTWFHWIALGALLANIPWAFAYRRLWRKNYSQLRQILDLANSESHWRVQASRMNDQLLRYEKQMLTMEEDRARVMHDYMHLRLHRGINWYGFQMKVDSMMFHLTKDKRGLAQSLGDSVEKAFMKAKELDFQETEL